METLRSVTQSTLIRKVHSHAVQDSGDLVAVCQPLFLHVLKTLSSVLSTVFPFIVPPSSIVMRN